MSDPGSAERRVNRERAARKEAERLLEEKSRSLYETSERLRESETRLRAILDTVASGIITIDENLIVESINATALELFGRTESEVIGETVSMLMPEPDLGPRDRNLRYDANMRRIIESAHEVIGVRSDGTSVPLERVVSEGRLAERAFFTIIVYDITERMALEAHLRQAQKLESIGQLAAGIAHEINTPIQYVSDNALFFQEGFRDLTPLLIRASELADAVGKGAETSDLAGELRAALEDADAVYLCDEIPSAIEESLEGIGRVAKIVKAMKEFSHPGGEMKEAADLNRAIESTITVASNEWKHAAVMETDLDPDLPLVPCLIGDFNQVILNLIVNAAHAITASVGQDAGAMGTITIRTRRKDDHAVICIADTGSGIPEEIRDKIFDPFFTTKEVGKGIGQGLAIAHAVVVEKHQGKLFVDSEVGKGTTFEIRLPMEDHTAAHEKVLLPPQP
ncbi:MAG: PAS domain S-box protein [bacterium]|nr:PAS domain S-box protein [bacterium]